jgi:predicted PurR-regulated permease PerM
MIRARLRGLGRDKDVAGEPEGADASDPVMEIDPAELTGVFRAPGWLRDLGIASWLLIGVLLFLAGMVWLLALTSTIVLPVLTASIIAAVASPVVNAMQGRGVPRAAGTLLIMLAVVLGAAGMTLLIVNGISDQREELGSELSAAADKVKSWAEDAGISKETAEKAKDDASTSSKDGVSSLLKGAVGALESLAGLAVFLSFTVLSLFFLLKDGPRIRDWIEAHLGLPKDVARTVTQRTIGSLRGYFVGVTIVAAFNGVVIGLGALVLGVPMPGSIAVVNFVAAYIPYIGAWSAGIFTVLIALSGEGPAVALAMAAVVLLANGILQQMIQPIAYGAALGIHPLAVLIVTIAGGALFGTIGLILAAPLTAAATKIAGDLGRARAEEESAGEGSPAPGGG